MLWNHKPNSNYLIFRGDKLEETLLLLFQNQFCYWSHWKRKKRKEKKMRPYKKVLLLNGTERQWIILQEELHNFISASNNIQKNK